MVIHSLLALLTIFSLSRMDLPMRSVPDIQNAISHYGVNLRGLRHVLCNGSESIEHGIEERVQRLPIADLNSLVRLDADDTGNVPKPSS